MTLAENYFRSVGLITDSIRKAHKRQEARMQEQEKIPDLDTAKTAFSPEEEMEIQTDETPDLDKIVEQFVESPELRIAAFAWWLKSNPHVSMQTLHDVEDQI